MTPKVIVTALIVILGPAIGAKAQHLPVPAAGTPENRLPPIPVEKMTEAQLQASADYTAARPDGMGRSGTGNPNLFWVYIRVPQVFTPMLRLQEVMHVHPRISQKLVHFVMLITSRHWTNSIWNAHDEDGVTEGLSAETVKALAIRRRPPSMPEDEEIMYDLCTRLLQNHSVSDATYARAVATFGEEGTVMAGLIVAEYSFISLATNLGLPESAKRAGVRLPAFPR